MRKLLFTLPAVCLLIVAGCKKDSPKLEEKIKTPLHAVLDGKFLSNSNRLFIVDYKAYKASQDLDGKVLDAAQQTADGNYGFDRIVIKGKDIDTYFDKGSKKIPAAYYLTTETNELHKGTIEKPWKGILTIEYINGNISDADLVKNIEIVRIGGSQYSNNGIYTDFFEQKTTTNKMTLKFGYTNKSSGVYFKVISRIPVKFKVQYDIEYSFAGLTDFYSNIPESQEQPKVSTNTLEIVGNLYASGAILAFQNSMADYYWEKNVVPFLN